MTVGVASDRLDGSSMCARGPDLGMLFCHTGPARTYCLSSNERRDNELRRAR